MSAMMNGMGGQRGFTLIEMMIALMMSLLVMAAVASVFISSSDANRQLQGLAELQSNARFAVNLLQRTVQDAGYTGCMAKSTTIANQLTSPTSYTKDFTVPLNGYEATSATAWNVTPDGSILAALGGNDILTVRGAVGPMVNVQAGMSAVTGAVPISSNNYFGSSTWLLVSNCDGFADVFEKTNTAASSAAHAVNDSGGTPVNTSSSLSRIYGPPAFAVPIDSTSFFVSPSNTSNCNSLYIRRGTRSNKEEMVLGVDGMQIQYGVTTTSDTSANEYLTADQVTDWTKVVSVRIGLLMSTPDPAARAADTVQHTVLGAVYPAFNDTRLRRVFTTTISLRNRSLQ